MGDPGKRWTREAYDLVASELRASAPSPNFSAISRKLARSRGSIVRCWERGWSTRQWPAVKTLIEQEQAARTAVPVVEVDEAERERLYLKKLSGAALGRGGNLLHIAAKLEKYGVALVGITEKASVEGILPVDAVQQLGIIGRFQRATLDVAQRAVELKKLVDGAAPPPLDINMNLSTLSLEQVKRELEVALADLKQAELQGLDQPEGSAAPPALPVSPDTWTPPASAPAARLPVSPDGGTPATTAAMFPAAAPIDDDQLRMTCCGWPMLRHGSDGNELHKTFFCPRCRKMTRSLDGGRSFNELQNVLPIASA